MLSKHQMLQSFHFESIGFVLYNLHIYAIVLSAVWSHKFDVCVKRSKMHNHLLPSAYDFINITHTAYELFSIQVFNLFILFHEVVILYLKAWFQLRDVCGLWKAWSRSNLPYSLEGSSSTILWPTNLEPSIGQQLLYPNLCSQWLCPFFVTSWKLCF
jgi:hypothetical protein